MVESENAFVRFRRLSHTWHVAMAGGISDSEYLAIVANLSERLAEVDGDAPSVTPLRYSEQLAALVKNETVNVSGSHKGRHLIGTALHLEVADRLGANTRASTLAIASCGNAALAAAVVANAAGRKLRVFIPPEASQAVVKRLTDLGAERVICERRESDPPGDPCYLRFVEAVRDGALPFSCQGGDNALALVGGQTLGWELVEQTLEAPASDVYIQIGGGALASSTIQAFSMAQQAGIVDALPRFHAVQTKNAHPLVRAWGLLVRNKASTRDAREQRAKYMWPWESAPESIAGGILDDETYDWLSILGGLEASGGDAMTVSEDELRLAHERATETGIAVCTTGSSGLAGLLAARSRGATPERPLVLLTGIER